MGRREQITGRDGETHKVHLHHKVVLGIAQALAAKIRKGKLRFAELGVWRGLLSHLIARELPNSRLLLVDRWGPPPPAKFVRHKDVGDRMSLRPQDLQAGALEEVRAKMAPMGDRVEIIVGETNVIGLLRKPQTLDLAFIDGGHYKEQCLADCRAWWPVIAEGGILAGHDFGGKYEGIVAATTQFAKREDLPLWRTTGSIWLMFKPPLRGLEFPEFEQKRVYT